MNKHDSLICLNCEADNQLNAHICCQCGQSLAASRTSYYLDLTNDDIINGRYDYARNNLAKADVEMLALSNEQRRCNLLTARAFWLQSQIYYYKAQTNEAHVELLLALQNLEGQAGGEALLANVLNYLGNIELYHDNPPAAIAYYQRSSEVALQVGKHAIAARAMGNLGIIHADGGRLDEALACYTGALEQAELSGEPLQIAEIHRLLASIYATEGPYSLALSYTEKAIAMRPQISDQASVCRIMSEAGQVYCNYRDLEQAEVYLNEAQEIAQRIGYKLVQVSNLINLAELMRLKGSDEAWFNYASRAFNQVGSAVSQRSSAALQLIMYYISQQDWVHAHKYMQALEDSVNDASPYVERSNLQRARALLHTALQQWDEAENYFSYAVNLTRATHDPYRLANFQEEYAAMLLQHAAAEPDPAIYAQARATLEEVAATFRSLEMPLRLATIEAVLEQIAAHPQPQAVSLQQTILILHTPKGEQRFAPTDIYVRCENVNCTLLGRPDTDLRLELADYLLGETLHRLQLVGFRNIYDEVLHACLLDALQPLYYKGAVADEIAALHFL